MEKFYAFREKLMAHVRLVANKSASNYNSTNQNANDTNVAIPVLGVTVLIDTNGYLDRLLRSIDVRIGTVIITWYGSDPKIKHVLEQAKKKVPCENFVVRQYPSNMGCAFGYNAAILEVPEAPWWLLTNYDISFPPGVLARIGNSTWAAIRKGHERRRPLALQTFNYTYGATNLWSNFAITAASVHRVGFFDENIFPAFCEDGMFA